MALSANAKMGIETAATGIHLHLGERSFHV